MLGNECKSMEYYFTISVSVQSFSYLAFAEAHLWGSVFFVADVALIVELFVTLDDHVSHGTGLLQSVHLLYFTSNTQ